MIPSLGAGPATAGAGPVETVDIGVLAVRAAESAEARWQPTADYLTERLGEDFDARFRMRAMNYPELENAVAGEEIDFVLTNTGHYVQLEYAHGISRLTTLIASHEGEPVRLFGGVIFTRADRDDITALEHIAGQHLFAVQEGSLGGWHAGHEALLDAGVDPREDLAELTFTDMPHDRVVEAVLDGRADAGTVRTGVLDRMAGAGAFEPGELRVLEPRDTPGFPFEHTTRLFPEWPFSRMEHADEALANAVTVALLEMPEGHPASGAGEYFGWAAPLSYAPVHDLLERLGAPPYERNPALDPLLYWRENPAITIALLLGLLALMAAATMRYHRINRDLGREVQQRREAETRLRRHEAELAHRASHDPLTDLPNRVLLTQRMRSAINTSAEDGGRIAILFLDLDRFKTINDSLGHQVGDELLKILADRLKDRVRANTIARLGGDEFIVLLDDVESLEALEERAREILAVIAEPFAVGGWRSLQVGGSLGITLFPDNGGSPEALITQADAAMYRAKAQGRNTFSFYSEDLTAAASERLETENHLREALKNGHLEVFYQPQIDLRERRVSGVEALVRWRDPDKGLIPPGRFIPVAEETGLISPLGEFVLREACRQVVEWDRQGLPELSLAVNLSAHQMNDPALVARVREVLDSTGMDPARLVLEMTETTLIQAEGSREVLLQLKGLGVALAIDDFGTGYSSLAYLKRFNIDWLKIDRAFVQDLPHDPNDAELTVTIINMAHNLGLEVLAEGVETEDQRSFLQTRYCDAWQGFLCSPPVPAEELPQLLEDCEGGVAAAGVPR